MCIKFKKTLFKKYSSILPLIVWIIVFFSFLVITKSLNVNTEVIVVSLTVITSVAGYFLAHYLEINRKIKEKKVEQYFKLIKATRIFIQEEMVIKDDNLRKELVDNFQNTYLGASIFISADVYSEFKNTIEKLIQFLNNKKDRKSLDEYTSALSKFVNRIRNELGEGDIEFNNYDFKIK